MVVLTVGAVLEANANVLPTVVMVVEAHAVVLRHCMGG